MDTPQAFPAILSGEDDRKLIFRPNEKEEWQAVPLFTFIYDPINFIRKMTGNESESEISFSVFDFCKAFDRNVLYLFIRDLL